MSYILDALRKADAGRGEAAPLPAIGAALQGLPPPRAPRWPWILAGLASTLALILAVLLLDGGGATQLAPLWAPAATTAAEGARPAALAAAAEQAAVERAAAEAVAQQAAVQQRVLEQAAAERAATEAMAQQAAAQQRALEQAAAQQATAQQRALKQAAAERAATEAMAQQAAAQQRVLEQAAAERAAAEAVAEQAAVPAAPSDPAFRADVIGVMDGCKVELRRADDAYIAELHGVVCPERDDPLAREARRFTTRAVFTREVQVQPSAPVSGSYISAELLMPDGQSLNAALVALGLAWTLTERYAPVEAEARRRQLGMWAAPAR